MKIQLVLIGGFLFVYYFYATPIKAFNIMNTDSVVKVWEPDSASRFKRLFVYSSGFKRNWIEYSPLVGWDKCLDQSYPRTEVIQNPAQTDLILDKFETCFRLLLLMR